MNFKPDEKNIRSLLKSGCQFVIPRFQREYSWDKKNYQEFFEDMINNLNSSAGQKVMWKNPLLSKISVYMDKKIYRSE